MILQINDVNDNLFYWCNSLGEINMPGDGMPGEGKGLIVHRPEELPTDVRRVYESYQEDDSVCRYTVTLSGKPGLLLTSSYTPCYVSDKTGIEESDVRFPEVMAKVYDYLAGKAVMMNYFAAPNGCAVLLGETIEDEGHELSLFIPITAPKTDFERFIEMFREVAYSEPDNAFLTSIGIRVKKKENA